MNALDAGLGAGETPIFPIHIFRVKKGVNAEEGSPNYDLFKLACKVSAKRMFPNFSFQDAPYNLRYYEAGRPETEIAYMGCRTRVIGNVYDPENEIAFSRGNLSFTTINLPRIGIELRNDPLFNDTPFEQCEVRFRLKAPEFVWKQWLRHRIASINETSLRYSKDVVLEFYEPKVWRDAKGNPLPDDVQRMLSENLRQNHETYRKIYQWRLDNGVALEQARIDMPATRITDAWWKCNLREAIHFMTLRGDDRAQLEIRRYARRMCDLLSKPFPVATTAFREICVDSEASR